MHPRTIATLEELENARWFSRVGIKKDSTTAIVVGSWPEAIEHCDSFDWDCLRTEAMNQYCESIFARSRERWNLWNEVAREVKRFTVPLVDSKIEAVVREHQLPEVFGIRVRMDIGALCMESEYADVCPLGFFTSISYWYVNGHFPCGWSGNMPWGPPPQGKLVIY
jgi:hypothetical protein